MRLLSAALCVAAVTVLVGCGAAALPRQTAAGPLPRTGPQPTAPPSSEPLPQAAPFSVTLEGVAVVSANNAEILGSAAAAPDTAAAHSAAAGAAAALGEYLNAQFVRRDTFFSIAGVEGLLAGETRAAVASEGLRALGVLDRDDVRGTVSGTAVATAQVVIDGAAVHSVALDYTATFRLALAAGEGPVEQTGTVAFVMRDGAWQAVLADVSLAFGGALEAALG